MKKKMNKRTLRRGKNRGNMDVSLALLRCALACSAFIVTAGALSVSGAQSKWPAWLTLLVQLAMSLLCFGLPAYRGLYVADGDQSGKLCRRALGAGQLLYLALSGALLVCPMTLMNDLILAPFVRMGLSGGASSTPPAALFLPMVLKSAIAAPICEELFFRGYLPAVLREAGVRGGAVISSLLFALVHGMNGMFLPRFLLGLLLFGMMTRTDSLLASVLLHAAYNLTILLLSFAGLGVLFSGIGFVSGLVRLAGCAALIVTLKQAYLAKRENGELRFGRRLSLTQCVLVSVALAAAIYIPLVLTVLGAAGGHA